ncbi:response regulator transcription factor [Paraburkholderia sp. MMS20-SJTN17]|uniref:Response regulator transcription factor n=1 Tax=Paraburkholderia translucens TaxID=2886945 RepID=A0ABS8K7P9_9BURK|nr:response regulator transcription factor [Paraburkholderia sp. MMS20-SJTN17]MCC8400749.1 response regulator transcription factor [Paraburkholderia sp. MMS20-SJTN17]
MAKIHRVLIVDDQPLLRGGLCSMVRALPLYSVAGEAGDGIAACSLAATLLPDLILMDLSMPGKSGVEAIAHIKRHLPQIRIIALTIHSSDFHMRKALAAGVDGYVLKDASFDELVEAMRLVMLGQRNATLDAYGARHDEAPDLASNMRHTQTWSSLTCRERTVLRLVAEGCTNREVGEQLHLSPKTIEKHRASLMRKLGVSNATGLVHAALDLGVLALPDDATDGLKHFI